MKCVTVTHGKDKQMKKLLAVLTVLLGTGAFAYCIINLKRKEVSEYEDILTADICDEVIGDQPHNRYE